MLKNIKEKYDINISQIFKILSILSIGYICIYKITLMNLLNIEWYIGLIAPQQLILSSIEAIFLLISSIAVGLIFIKMKKMIEYETDHLLSLLIVGTILIALMSIFSSSNLELGGSLNFNIILIIVGAGYVFLWFINEEAIKKRKKKAEESQEAETHKKPTYISRFQFGFKISLLIIIFVGIPVIKALKEYKEILKNSENTLATVILKDNEKDEWYLIEAGIDSNLIVKKTTLNKEEREFKIVKIEEIEKIKIKK